MLLELKMPPEPNRKIDGYSVYKLYLMVKGHFNNQYDCIKYNWVMRVSTKAYEKRRDKYFFERLSKKYTLGELYKIFLCNVLSNPDAWVGDISGADALQFYRQQMGKLERASYIFKEDIENLSGFCETKGIRFQDLFSTASGQPLIFKMLQQEIISYETFILMHSVFGFISKLDSDLKDDIIWIGYKKRLMGYIKLLDINKVEAKEIFISAMKK